MNVNSSVLRMEQIRVLGMGRSDLRSAIWWINAWIIHEYPWISKLIEEFVSDQLMKYSYQDLRILGCKLREIAGISLPDDVPIPDMFYKLIVSEVLLPIPPKKWGDTLDETELLYKKELTQIIQRSISRIDSIIGKNVHSPLYMSLGDERVIHEEIDEMWELELYSGYIWEQFWTNYIGYNQDQEKFVCDIPVRIASPWKSPNTPEKQEINPEIIKTLIVELFWKTGKTPKEKRFGWFFVKTKIHTDNTQDYGPIKKSRYISIIVSHDDVVDLGEASMWVPEIIAYLKKFLDLQNYIIAEVAQKIGWNGKDRRKSLYTDDGTYYQSKKPDDDIDPEISEKFSKLLLKIKEPVKLDDIGGQEKAKLEIKKLIALIKNPELALQYGAEPPSGMIFYGPSGTGKTLLGRAMASSIHAEVFNIKMTDIANTAYINEWSKNVADLFRYLRGRAEKDPDKRIVIIMDEIDALFKNRSNSNASQEDGKIVNTFLTEMDGLESLKNVIFVGTTNRLDSIDPAVRRSWRFGTHIKVDLPGVQEREEIFRIAIKKTKQKAKIDLFDHNIDYSELAKESEWLSGADIQHIIDRCVSVKFYAAIENTGSESSIGNTLISEKLIEVKSQNGNKNKIIQTNTLDLIRDLMEKDKTTVLYQSLLRNAMEKVVMEVRQKLDSGELTVKDILSILDEWKNIHWVGFLSQ